MPPLVLNAAQETAAMALGTSELKYLLAKEGVTARIQALLFHVGVTTLARFSTFAGTDVEMKQVLKDDMNLDATSSLAARGEVSGIIVAWKAAANRTDELSKHLGTLDATRQGKPLLGSEYLVMKGAFEQLHGKLEDVDAPARVYLERRIAEMESGEMRAESLTTVLNREQDGEETLLPQWDSAGAIKLRRSVADIAEPANPEELRRRLSVMFTGLMFIAMQHTNRGELQTLSPAFTHCYAGYLLGEHCWQLVARDSEGRTIAAPNWSLIIRHEHAIRKRAYRIMQESGRAFEVCLRESWLDPLTKERSFTTPLAIAAATGNRAVEIAHLQEHVNSSDNPRNAVLTTHLKGDKSSKGKAKGGRVKGGGGGKGGKKAKGGGGKLGKGGGGKPGKGGKVGPPSGCAPKTPDGRAVCFGFNDWEVRCKDPNCWFVHVCGICFQVGHAMYNCRGHAAQKATVGPETQGAGH